MTFPVSALQGVKPLEGRRAVLALVLLIFSVSVVNWYWDLSERFAFYSGEWSKVTMEGTSALSVGMCGRLVSYALVHGDPAHLVGNLVLFWIFGVTLCDIVGWRWFLVVFVLSTAGGAAGQLWTTPASFAPMVGASGAVTGFAGAYFTLYLKKRRPDPAVWPIAHPIEPGRLVILALAGVVMDLYGVFGIAQEGYSNVAYGAHLGGFASGALIMLFRLE